MHKKRLSFNTFSSLMLEVVTLICGLILPRLIIKTYGSEVNGLVNSVKQFLSVVSFLEFGIGAVVKSSLYKSLAEKDVTKTSEVISSAGKFFRKIGIVLAGYVIVLMILYPMFTDNGFSMGYTAFLIIAISLSLFAQYFFGCVDTILLISDQRGYIQASAQIITLIANAIVCAVLIKLGFGIHVVQFSTAALYVLRPVVIRIYVRKHYKINYNIKYDTEPIQQKWNGIAQHIAYIVLESTDIIVLTIFASLTDVSVYSVYIMVIRGIKQLFVSTSEGFQSLFGEYISKDDIIGMKNTFNIMEWLYGTATTFVYGCSAFLIVPFVSVYTYDINDVNYNQPLFAIIMIISFWIYNNNAPYHSAILAAGHYRQTQNYFIVAAVINILISIIAVHKFGLIGVAVGTFAAMFFQTIWMMVYNVRHISKRSPKMIIKQFGIDAIIIMASSIMSSFVRLDEMSWFGWVVMGIKIAFIWGVVSFVVNIIFYNKIILNIIKRNE